MSNSMEDMMTKIQKNIIDQMKKMNGEQNQEFIKTTNELGKYWTEQLSILYKISSILIRKQTMLKT